MDNLAHTLIGVGVARAGLAQKCGKGTTLTLAIASNLPDIDALWAWWDGWDRFMLRRTHTHALVMVPVLAALLALAIRWRYPDLRWRTLLGLSTLGVGLHILFDWVNSFGVVLFWPFSRARWELASVFIIDPVVWLLMAGPLLARRLRVMQAGVAALGLYVVLCWAGHARTEALVRRTVPAAEVIRVFPEPLGPHRFRGVAKVGPTWRVFLVRPLTGKVEPRALIPSQLDGPRVAEIRASEHGKALEWFMAAPVWGVLPDGTVEVCDLRFLTLTLSRSNPFVVAFPPGQANPVVR